MHFTFKSVLHSEELSFSSGVQAEALSKVDQLAAEREETDTKLKVRSYVCRVKFGGSCVQAKLPPESVFENIGCLRKIDELL